MDKNIEKYARLVGLTDQRLKIIAYQSSNGPVSDCLKRYLDNDPTHDWAWVKAELQLRFAEVVDAQLLLRKVKQKEGETIQVYAENLTALEMMLS